AAEPGGALMNLLLPRAPRSFLSGDSLKIWTNPRATPNIVVLVRSTLYISAIAPHDLNRAAQLLSTGTAPEQVFGDHHRAVPLMAVSRAEVDVRSGDCRFQFDSGSSTRVEEFRVAGRLEADELTAILRQQLGPLFKVTPLGFDLIRLWGMPLAALLIHA